MKRLLFIWVFFLTHSVFALYFGNPSTPLLIEKGCFFATQNKLAVKVGYQRDWVFNRGMKSVSKFSGCLNEFSYIADQGLLKFNLCNLVELYGSAGAAHFYLAQIPMKGVRNEYETHNQFAWGIGLRSIIYSWEKVTFGGDVKYERSQPTLRWITTNGQPIQSHSGSKLHFHEWQVGLGISYQTGIFYPYLGVKYSNATGRLQHLPAGFLPNTSHLNMKSRRKFGLALGCSLSNLSRFALTVETRLIDEQAISLAGEVKF